MIFMSDLVWISVIFVVSIPFSIQHKNLVFQQASHNLDIDPPVQQRRLARRFAQQSALHLHHLPSQVVSEKNMSKKISLDFFSLQPT